VLQIQRERIDLQIQEQRAFAEFMTPVQRARYAALRSSCAAEPRSSADSAWVRTPPSARTTCADLRGLVAGSAHRASEGGALRVFRSSAAQHRLLE